MTDVTIDADQFGTTIENLLSKLDRGVEQQTPKAVDKALKKGEKAWKRNARSVLSGSYVIGGWGNPRYGKVVTTGKYAASIKHHMMSRGGRKPEGEIGSPKLPGLPHLLEKGHARIGGGYVPGRQHIAPAAQEAFDDFERLVDEAVEEAINGL